MSNAHPPLTSTQFRLLSALRLVDPDTLGRLDLRRVTRFRHTVVAAALDNLVLRGHVERIPHNDRYRITTKGRKAHGASVANRRPNMVDKETYQRAKARTAGWRAGIMRRPADSNTRRPGTTYPDDWLAGWTEATAELKARGVPANCPHVPRRGCHNAETCRLTGCAYLELAK